ncbi:MAG: hypothetical protein PHV82_06160 [Victivallaceae bacterium]|nr:hypothetical protein [Victivallaceae bacterium]
MKNGKSGKESGIALVAVLCTVLTVSLLVASAVAISQYAALETATFSGISRSFYVAEGAAARIRWLIMADHRKYPNRKLEQTEADAEGNDERFLADAAAHEMNYYGREISYRIEDAVGGIDISGSSPENNLRSYFTNSLQEENDPEFAKFCARLHDYADSDDLVSLNGLEQKGYRDEKLYNLPRNNKLQFTQELMYIPGFADYFQPDQFGRVTVFRLIPPEGTGALRGRPNLFSSPMELIKNKCKLSDKEAEDVEAVLKDWRSGNSLFSNSSNPGLEDRLLTYFSVTESGCYTVIVNTAAENSPGTTLIYSFRYNPAAKGSFEYYQFTYY